jgi:phosphatidylinositol glycan class S
MASAATQKDTAPLVEEAASTPSASAPAAAPSHIEPPPEKPFEIKRRSYVVLSFWLIIILLGIPIWWKTTSIYRADLPLDAMLQWADGKVRLSILSIRLDRFMAKAALLPF